MRLVIIGGGGFRVPLVYRALSAGKYAGLIDSVVLYDVDSSRLAAIQAVLAAAPFSGPVVIASTSLPQALEGADIVFAATRVGGTEGRVLDERVALDLGVLGQETTGAGGISYAFRSIPFMIQLAQEMRNHCPAAWLINFTNPAGMVTQALVPLLGAKVIGICDSPLGLVRRAAKTAGMPLSGMNGVDYLGLNHLGWLNGLVHDGVDQLPGLLSSPARLAEFEEGRLFGADFLAALGSLPNEYLFYYYRRHSALQAIMAAAQTRGASIALAQQMSYPQFTGAKAFERWDAARLEREAGYLAESRDSARDEADLAGGGYEEVALAAMNALLTGQSVELILNVRNGSTLPPLASDAVIEVPSRVDSSGATPLPLLSSPTAHQLGLMAQLKAVENAVVRAVLERNREQALLAFALHPLIGDEVLAHRLLEGYEQAFPALPGLWRRLNG